MSRTLQTRSFRPARLPLCFARLPFMRVNVIRRMVRFPLRSLVGPSKNTFLCHASGSDLTCRAEVLRAGKNLVFTEAEVMVDSYKGKVVVAKASSTLAVIPLNEKRAGEASTTA